jgi:hypothetical protein
VIDCCATISIWSAVNCTPESTTTLLAPTAMSVQVAP